MISAPQLLILFRAVCAPAIFVLACFGWPGSILAGVLVAGFLSDVFDGMIARRMGTATASLRYADTLVDTAFYTAAAAALAIAVPGAFEASWLPLVALVTIHVSRATFELTKYGRIASYHMWSSKAFGLLLVVALTYGFITGPNPLVAWAVWWGILNELEGFATSAILPAWVPDVPSVLHAYRRS
ncbi:MAG TPA: CDP-alcohol phosphatidyltransferase family protein [Vicinamibacterales bacterium]|nr:CDP-alcohol phosphatidyltransferase family protein [Vicinamibacterales bacterium]